MKTLKNTISEIRNSMDGLSRRIKMAKEQVRKPECRSIQIIQSEEEQQDFREMEL